MQNFIVEIDGRRFVDIVKILPETLPSGKRILWKELNKDLIEVSVDKHSARGGNAKTIIIKKLVPVCELLFEGLGLRFGDGIKWQGGLKVFGFSNTEIQLHKHFLKFSDECLGLKPFNFNARVSIPPKLKEQILEIEMNISNKLKIPLENFWKTQVLERRNLSFVDVKINSTLLGVSVNLLFEKLRSILFQNQKFIASFLRGIIASDGNINVRKCGRLGEIMIAAKEKNERDFIRDLLKQLCIHPNKDKETEGDEGVLVHGLSNFNIFDNWKLTKLHPQKHNSFLIGLGGFKVEQFRKGHGKLIILEGISKNLKTSSKLSKLINRTDFMTRVHLRHLHKMRFIKKEKVIGRKIIWKITKAGQMLLSLHDPIQKLKNL